MEQRIIGRYDGVESGPLLICIGGIHGNEPAGVDAILEVQRLLNLEPSLNPTFSYHGSFVGLRGNLRALAQNQRYKDRDLNRMLIAREINIVKETSRLSWTDEDIERIELTETIEQEIKKYNPDFTLILDFHTTTADGGIFTIAANDEVSKKLAIGLHAPVILGIAEGLEGTTIEYFNNPLLNRYCIVFEAGQHSDPACVHRSVAAVINCMRHIGSVDRKDVDHKHDGLLIEESKGLPRITKLVYHYKIGAGDQFVMNPGYTNFKTVKKGEPLAMNQWGTIEAPMDGLILMPKYQVQGEDGFFIVETL